MNRTSNAVDDFVGHFAIQSHADRDALLSQIAAAFSHLPYENLTKLIRKHTEPPGASRRRTPADVMGDHIALGTGGTCFALSTLFEAVLQHFGFECFVALCDSRRAADSHCALVVTLDGTPHLIDPGYLIYHPLPMRAGRLSQQAAAAPLRLVGDRQGQSFELSAGGKPRYHVKNAPVSEAQLLDLWDASFDWTMMNDVHICQTEADGYAYLHGTKLRHQGQQARSTDNVRTLPPVALGERFGIDPRVIEQAYDLVRHDRQETPTEAGSSQQAGAFKSRCAKAHRRLGVNRGKPRADPSEIGRRTDETAPRTCQGGHLYVRRKQNEERGASKPPFDQVVRGSRTERRSK